MRPGFRVDATRLVRKLKRAQRVAADDFDTELRDYTSKTLATAVRLTPRRLAGKITASQSVQWDRRINNIPSAHTLENPTLRVNRQGVHLLYLDGVWYNASHHKLPGKAQAAYARLKSERSRRMRGGKAAFIRGRRQARDLFARSWYEVAQSLGLRITVASVVVASGTRRNASQARNGYTIKYAKNYGVRRGGKGVLTYSIFVGLLETPSRYKTFSHQQIMASARARHSRQYILAVESRARKVLKKALA